MLQNCNKEPTHARYIAHAWGFYFGIYFIYFLGLTPLKGGRALCSNKCPKGHTRRQSLSQGLRYVFSTDTYIKSWPCNFRPENVVLGHNFIYVSNVHE